MINKQSAIVEEGLEGQTEAEAEVEAEDEAEGGDGDGDGEAKGGVEESKGGTSERSPLVNAARKPSRKGLSGLFGAVERGNAADGEAEGVAGEDSAENSREGRRTGESGGSAGEGQNRGQWSGLDGARSSDMHAVGTMSESEVRTY